MPDPAATVRRLAELTGVPADADMHFDWPEIEHGIGLRLPADYKLLAEAFPSGWVRQFVRLHKPERPQAGPQRLDSFSMAQLETLRLWRDEGQGEFPYPLYPEPGGLLPWGHLRDAGYAFWLTEPGDEPDSWPVVIAAQECDVWARFDGPLAEFLAEVAAGRYNTGGFTTGPIRVVVKESGEVHKTAQPVVLAERPVFERDSVAPSQAPQPSELRLPSPLTIRDFGTWAPLLMLLWTCDQEGLSSPGGHVAGRVGRRGYGWTEGPGQRLSLSGDVLRAVAEQIGFNPVTWVQEALTDAGIDGISFVAEFPEGGRATLHLLEFGPAVEVIAGGIGLGSLVLVEGALPAPWRRQPAPARSAAPAASADLALLERTLRERLPDAIGATEAEIAAAESRLGLTLPDELKALYRVTRARGEDWGDDSWAVARVRGAVGCYPFPLDQLYIADVSARPCPWLYAATEAAVTPPGAAVQELAGSPGWIVFGGDGAGGRVAIDLTPGPRGNTGQVIMINRGEEIGADLLARSLTALVTKNKTRHGGRRRTELPAVARVNRGDLRSIEAAADPGLEVLSIGVWEGEPLSLAPVAGLPRLRTLTAYPGTLADPLEVARLTGLEFLELGPDEWRVLLGADAVPRTLLAAAVAEHARRNPLQLVLVANEILARWGRPLITETILDGDLNEAL